MFTEIVSNIIALCHVNSIFASQGLQSTSHVEKEKYKQWRHVAKTVDFVMNLCPPNTEERYLQKRLKYLLN
jgi:hypothetical protein